MPTFKDIPVYFMYLDQRENYMTWVRGLPLNRDQRKELLFIWSNALDTTWTGEQVAWVLGPD